MSRTLKLIDHLLARGRTLQEIGRDQDALHLLGRLARFRELPIAVAEETQARLAEIQIRRRKYLRARRHLAVALGYQPQNAHYHYLMGAAVDADDRADPDRAVEHYRQSLELNPEQPDCQVDFGLLCLELGRTEEGLVALRRAAELAPDDPEVLGAVVEGFCQEDHADEARALLLAARFRHARDARFQKLWNDFQFGQIREAQSAARRRRRKQRRGAKGPVLLPFVRPVTTEPVARKVIRHDPPQPVPPPHPPRPIRLYDQEAHG